LSRHRKNLLGWKKFLEENVFPKTVFGQSWCVSVKPPVSLDHLQCRLRNGRCAVVVPAEMLPSHNLHWRWPKETGGLAETQICLKMVIGKNFSSKNFFHPKFKNWRSGTKIDLLTDYEILQWAKILSKRQPCSRFMILLSYYTIYSAENPVSKNMKKFLIFF
jgi:hypothetical protein